MDNGTVQKLIKGWGRDPKASRYLTDGCKLFRVIVVRTSNDETLVELEDCQTLDVWLVPADELRSLRRVRQPRAERTEILDAASWSSRIGSGA